MCSVNGYASSIKQVTTEERTSSQRELTLEYVSFIADDSNIDKEHHRCQALYNNVLWCMWYTVSFYRVVIAPYTQYAYICCLFSLKGL